jgi:hypothetical protein
MAEPHKEIVTIARRWFSSLPPLQIEIECAAELAPGVKLGLAVKAAFASRADLRDADLRDADLRDADLRDADLRDADLRDADLRDADLRDAVLRGADLRDADLRDADLRGAVLSGADLRGADLRDAVLRDAVLRGAVLSDADLRGAVLSDADLRDAVLPKAVQAMRPADESEQHARIAAVAALALADDDALNMGDWHTCETTHCIAGWAVHQAGPAGYLLEEMMGPHAAGAILLGDEAAKHFYDSGDQAREWLASFLPDFEDDPAHDTLPLIQDTIAMLTAAPVREEGGAVRYDVRTEGAPGITEPDLALATREEAPAELSGNPGELEAPAEAGEVEAQRLCEIFCDADPRNTPGDGAAWPYLTLVEKAQWVAVAQAALRAKPQAREEAQPVAWDHVVKYMDHPWLLASTLPPDFFAAIKNSPDWLVQPLYIAPPAPKAEKLRVAVEELRDKGAICRNNAESGSQDDRDAWATLSKWLFRQANVLAALQQEGR